MATATSSSSSLASRTTKGVDDPSAIRWFQWVSSTAILAVLCVLLVDDRAWLAANRGTILVWACVAVAADLMFVRIGKGLTLSMSLPVTLAAALLFPVAAAATIAFLGCLDPMELKGESSISRAVFNRCQVALATSAAAVVLHGLSIGPTDWPLIALACFLALLADFAVNASFVAVTVVLKTHTSPLSALRLLFGSEPVSSVALYLSMGLVAPLVAVVYLSSGVWALVSFLVPLALARSTLLRAERLHDAVDRINEKDEALRRSTETVGLERRDERMAVAGQLHDDVLPALYKVTLMGRVIQEDLESGRLLDLDLDVPELQSAVDTAQSEVRRLVGSLRRSSLGPGGLSVTLRLLSEDLESSGASPIRLDIASDLDGSDEALLVLYQVAKEALTNAAKYSQSSEVIVRAWPEGDEGRLVVIDSGIGFDLTRVDQRNHFGLQLMKERVESRGGRLVVESQLGGGTTIAAMVPLSLPEERRG
jgi:signal transduction histidine kinase